MKDYFVTLREYVKMVVAHSTNNLIITGTGAIGKTYQTLSVCFENKLELGKDFTHSGGFTTPLELYHCLYKNNGKLIILDDTDGVLSDKRAIAILKEALWGNPKRIVHYNTTSDKLEVEPEFEFTGSIILITNTIENERSENTKALLSRAIVYRLDFTREQMLEILAYVAEKISYKGLTDVEKAKVVVRIIEITDETTKELNLRSLIKCFDVYYHYKRNPTIDWKSLINELFTKDETLVLLNGILTAHSTEKERVKAFIEQSGMSRSTYYTYKRRLK